MGSSFKALFAILLAGAFLLAGGWLFDNAQRLPETPADISPTLRAEGADQPAVVDPTTLANCLTERGFKIYGTENCPNCKLQKEQFGSSFAYINYIDCDLQPAVCQAANIRGYPVWENSAGQQFPGAKRLPDLARISNCTSLNAPISPPNTPSPLRSLISKSTQLSVTNYQLLIAAFLAGLASFFAPCLLPLLPSYFSAVSGFTFKEIYGLTRSGVRRRLFVSTIFFVAGFSLVFSFLGATASAIGQFINSNLPMLLQISGLFLIVLGLIELGVIRFNALRFDFAWKIQKRLARFGFAAAVLTGTISALVWIPCIGPALGAILLLASKAGSASEGVILLFSYGLGIGAPFIVLSLAFPTVFDKLQKNRSALVWVSRLAGITMLAFGAVLIFQKYQIYITAFGRIVENPKRLMIFFP